MIRTVASLFPNLGSKLVTGSIKVEEEPSYRGPVLFVPALAGSVRFSNVDGSASASLPLAIRQSSDFVYAHVAQNEGWFTGVTILNPNAAPVDFTIDVYTCEGVLKGSYSSQLQPGERLANLLWQLVPASAGQTDGYIRITSSAYLTSFALFGSGDLQSLSAIQPQALR